MHRLRFFNDCSGDVRLVHRLACYSRCQVFIIVYTMIPYTKQITRTVTYTDLHKRAVRNVLLKRVVLLDPWQSSACAMHNPKAVLEAEGKWFNMYI